MTYEIEVTEIASGVYTVEADSPEEARTKLLSGEFDSFRDLGHDDMQIHAVKEA